MQTNRHFQDSKKPFAVERKGERTPNRPKPPKAWNHQDELKSLKGKPFRIRTLAGATYEGTLLESDQFTLKIQRKTDESILTYFKSALEFFGAL
jgi:hypothetical protein